MSKIAGGHEHLRANHSICIPDSPYGIPRSLYTFPGKSESYLNSRVLSAAQKILFCKELFLDEASESFPKKMIKKRLLIPTEEISLKKDASLSICDDSMRASALRKSILNNLEKLDAPNKQQHSYLHLAPIALFLVLYAINVVRID